MRQQFLLLGTVSAVLAAPAADEVQALPGWDAALPSAQYSGFVNATRSTFHYWLVESTKHRL